MSTIATLSIAIVGNVAGLTSALSSAQSSINNFSGSLKSAGTRLSAGLTLPLAGVATAAIKAAADQEQLQIAFTTMLGSADKAKVLIADLSQFSASTPFQMPEVVTAGKQLLAFGVAAGDIEPTLKSLGDLAAGVGAPLGDMAYLFGTAKSQGRLFMADINQFSNRGIPIIEALATTMGVSTTAVRGLVEEGKVGFPELEAAIASLTGEGGKFGGLMEAQSQSLAGLWSTLKDNIGLTLITIGQSIIETFDLKTKLAGALAYLQTFTEKLVAFSKAQPGLFKLGITVAAVAAALGPLLVALGFVAQGVAALMPVVGGLAALFGLLLSPVGLLVIAVGALAGALLYFDVGGVRTKIAALLSDLGPLKEGLGEVAEAAKQLVTGEIGFGEFASVVTAQLTAAADAVRAWAAGFSWGDLLQGAGSTLQGLQSTVAGWFTSIDWESGLASGRAKIGELGATVGGWFAGVDWEGGLATAKSGIEGIGATISGFVTGTDWAGLASQAQAGWQQMSSTVNGWRDSVLSTLTGWVTGVDWTQLSLDFSGFIGRLADGIRGIDLSTIPFSEIMTGLMAGPLSKGLAVVKWLVGSEEFGGLATAVQTAIQNIQWAELLKSVGNLADAALDLVVGAANQMIQGYIEQITSIDWTQLSLDFAGLMSRLATAISEVDWASVGQQFGASIHTLFVGGEEGGGLAGLATAIYEAIKAIQWAEVFSAAGDLLTSLTTAIVQLVGGAFAGLFGSELTAEGTFTTPQWVTDLQSWLAGLIAPPPWVATLAAWLNGVRNASLSWVLTLTTWWTNVSAGALGWVTTLTDWWTNVTGTPDWVSAIQSWFTALDSWEWPSIPRPDWVDTVAGWFSKLKNAIPGLQLGTAYWQGGPTWVGEGGPELIWAPRGAQIMPHRESERYAAGMGEVTINVGPVTINSPMDAYELGLQIKAAMRRGY